MPHSFAPQLNRARDSSYYSYTARIRMLSNTWAIGSFESAAEAAKAYDVIAIGLHGRNAVLNFPASHYTLKDVTEVGVVSTS